MGKNKSLEEEKEMLKVPIFAVAMMTSDSLHCTKYKYRYTLVVIETHGSSMATSTVNSLKYHPNTSIFF